MNNQNKRTNNWDTTNEGLARRDIVLQGMPYTLILETGAVCTLDCQCCPQNEASFDITRDMLSLDVFKKITDYFKDYVDSLLLFNWGEPFLNPNIARMVEYAGRKNMKTSIHSNMNNCSAELMRGLIAGGLDELVASIDGITEETYRKYRREGSLAASIANLKQFTAIKKQMRAANPKIIWKFLVFSHNEHEIEQARQTAEKLEVEINFSFAVAPGNLSPQHPDYSNDNFKQKFLKHYGWPCEQLWRAPVICPDGTVLPCCMVNKKKYSMGNMLKEDFRKIWNNDKYQAWRRSAAGQKVDSNEDMFCRECMFSPENGLIKDAA